MALFWYHLTHLADCTVNVHVKTHLSDRKAAENRGDHKGSLNHLVLPDIEAQIYAQMCTTDLMARYRSKLCIDPVNSSSQPPSMDQVVSPCHANVRPVRKENAIMFFFVQVQSTH